MNAPIKTTPFISVLMSCYNAECWLDTAITSVLSQTFTDFEFIIIDDGSVDHTLEIIQKYAAIDSRIIVISKPNTGLSDSLNFGIQKARGDWIARLDADDVCEPMRLQKQFELAQSNPAVVFIGTGLTIIDENGVKLETHIYPVNHAALVHNLTSARKFPPHSSAFYSTKAVKSLGGYRNRLKRAEDWDLWLRLSELGELAAIAEPLLQIRKHADQISHSEGGSRQVLDSRIATVTYWLRKCGVPDPTSKQDENFSLFEAWVKERLFEAGVFQAQLHANRLRSCFKAISFPYGVLKFVAVFLSQPFYTIRYFQNRIIGETISLRLANEWIEKSKVH